MRPDRGNSNQRGGGLEAMHARQDRATLLLMEKVWGAWALGLAISNERFRSPKGRTGNLVQPVSVCQVPAVEQTEVSFPETRVLFLFLDVNVLK